MQKVWRQAKCIDQFLTFDELHQELPSKYRCFQSLADLVDMVRDSTVDVPSKFRTSQGRIDKEEYKRLIHEQVRSKPFLVCSGSHIVAVNNWHYRKPAGSVWPSHSNFEDIRKISPNPKIGRQLSKQLVLDLFGEKLLSYHVQTNPGETELDSDHLGLKQTDNDELGSFWLIEYKVSSLDVEYLPH